MIPFINDIININETASVTKPICTAKKTVNFKKNKTIDTPKIVNILFNDRVWHSHKIYTCTLKI